MRGGREEERVVCSAQLHKVFYRDKCQVLEPGKVATTVSPSHTCH